MKKQRDTDAIIKMADHASQGNFARLEKIRSLVDSLETDQECMYLFICFKSPSTIRSTKNVIISVDMISQSVLLDVLVDNSNKYVLAHILLAKKDIFLEGGICSLLGVLKGYSELAVGTFSDLSDRGKVAVLRHYISQSTEIL